MSKRELTKTGIHYGAVMKDLRDKRDGLRDELAVLENAILALETIASRDAATPVILG